MKFKINNNSWLIRELCNIDFQEIRKKLGGEQNVPVEEGAFVFGFCDYASHTIYLNDYQCEEEKKMTLIHELIHCWLWSHGASYTSYCEDALCDTVSSSHEFINKTIKEYFKGDDINGINN